MKAGRKPQELTPKETEIMRMLWNDGPLFVREMLERYPDPKPHFNTVATTARILEEKGFISFETIGGARRYEAKIDIRGVRRKKMHEIVGNFFHNSYSNVVSSLLEDEEITVDELKELIKLVERNKLKKGEK